MAWNGRQLINHPAELDIAHVRADAMNAPACTSRPFHSWTCVQPTRARAQFCRSSPLLSSLLLVRRILDLYLDVHPLVPVSSLSSSSIESVRLCLPDTLDPRPLDLPIGTVAATPSSRSTLECTLHPRLIVSRRHAIRARFRRLFR